MPPAKKSPREGDASEASREGTGREEASAEHQGTPQRLVRAARRVALAARTRTRVNTSRAARTRCPGVAANPDAWAEEGEGSGPCGRRRNTRDLPSSKRQG